MKTLGRIGRDLLQGIFPELCLHCGEKIVDRDFFCTGCAPRIGLQKPAADHPQFEQHYTFLYEGPLKTLFKGAKFSERRRALGFFARAAADDLKRFNNQKAIFIALPSRSAFLKKVLRASVQDQNLIFDVFRMKRSAFSGDANKTLGEAARYRRIHENLIWHGKKLPEAEHYVLCDDVSTTGATLGHAAQLLMRNGMVPAEKITLWSLMYRPRYFLMPRQ